MKRVRHILDTAFRKGVALLCGMLFLFSVICSGFSLCLCARTAEECGRVCHPVETASSATRIAVPAGDCSHLSFGTPIVVPSPETGLSIVWVVILPFCFASLLKALRAYFTRPLIPCTAESVCALVFESSYAALRRRLHLQS